MVSDGEAWWRRLGNYAPLQPYLKALNATISNINSKQGGWIRTYPDKQSAVGGKPSLLNEGAALTFFEDIYPHFNPLYTGYQTPSGEWTGSGQLWNPATRKFDIREGGYYTNPSDPLSFVASVPPSIYGGQFVPEPAPTVIQETPITTGFELPSVTIIPEAHAEPEPQPEQTVEYWVKKPSGKVERLKVLPSHIPQYESIGWVFKLYTGQPNPFEPDEPKPEPEQTVEYWVTKPSGVIERMKVLPSHIPQLESIGWVFSLTEPVIVPQPENQNVSVIFYIGKGGDLKTHFGINSIIITPDEAKNLADWLSQNYNTKILLVTNRLTNDVRSHTLQQIKDLIIQKLKDDQPEADDITPDDIKKPLETGFMGAGMVGAIAGLVLLGFIVDHKRDK